MRKKEVLEIKIDGMEFGGKSYSMVGEQKVEMKGGITGQSVKARVKKSRKNKAQANILEVIERSPIETADVCPHFGLCGGCMYLSVPYNEQLKLKEQMVYKLFDDAEITGFEKLPIKGSPVEHGYRNKMEYTFGDTEKDGPTTLGMHKKGRSFDIVTVDKCKIVHDDFNKILSLTLEYFKGKGIPHYNKKKHEGYLRHFVVRRGVHTGELMVNLITSSQLDIDLSNYKEMLLSLELESEIVSLLHTVNDDLADAVKCDEMRVLHGRDHIFEEVLGLRFKISPFSFFQTNTKGAEELYSVTREFAGESDGKTIFDLYSGTGTIGQILSKNAKKVIGIELIEEAVDAANENTGLNGIENCTFIAGDVSKKVSEIAEKPDTIVIDPPRSGVMPKAVSDIISFGAKELVYVSCNPKSLVENLKDFQSAGYVIEKVMPVDMFPHTPHCETVVSLKRKHSTK